VKTRAAIIRKVSDKLEVVDIELESPGQGELQIKMVASGLCHTDEHMRTMPVLAHYPHVLGHEGAGIVESVGPNTPGWQVGDHVVFSFLPSCGRCRWCARGLSNLCDLGRYTVFGSRHDDPPTYRFNLDGEPVGQLAGLGTFSERTVVSVNSALKVDQDLPLESLSLLGCGVGTGWGSAVYAAEVLVGDIVIVMGTGGVGINAVQGAAQAGAGEVVAVDPVEFKRNLATQFGATQIFSAMPEAEEFVKSVTNGQGADSAIVTVGVVKGEHIAQAIRAIRKGGTVVVTSMSDVDDNDGIPINSRELTVMQKRLQGALFGQCNPRDDVPRQIEMYRRGQLKLDELITRTYTLDQVNDALEDMNAGKNIRGVIRFD